MLAFALVLFLSAQGTPLDQLIQTERDFSSTSEIKGTRDAFLEFLADDGILFRPGPVNGKKWVSTQSTSPGLLKWRPVYADISAAGDLGYTTGPYEFLNQETVRTGNYFTIWQRQPDGIFKFVLDFGTANPPPASPPVERFPVPPPPLSRLPDPKERESAGELMLRLDRELAETLAVKGPCPALEAVAEDNIRVLRTGSFPAVGKAAMRELLDAKPSPSSFIPEKIVVAASADMAYTYGKAAVDPAGKQNAKPGYYVRIWKKQPGGGWRVALDIAN